MVTPDLIRSYRARRGLSQPALAALWGVPVATLRNWEQGRREPSAIVAALLREIAAMEA